MSYIESSLLMKGISGMANTFYDLDSGRGREFDPKDVPTHKKPIPKGCKEYTIDGFTVIAISEKSARKKVEKLKNKVKG